MNPFERARKNPMYLYLIVLAVCSTMGLQAWRTLFNNFAVEAAGLNGQHVGMIQSVREIPGFLALLAVYVIMLIKEHRLSALSILLLGLGIAATGLFPSYPGLPAGGHAGDELWFSLLRNHQYVLNPAVL